VLTDGFVRLPRNLQEHPFWFGEKFSKGQAMVDLLYLASFAEHEREIAGLRITLEIGDFAASIRFLSTRWKWSLKKTAAFMARLEKGNFLAKKRNGSGNGSPSIYHIEKEHACRPKHSAGGNGPGNAEDTVGIRLGNEDNRGKNKGKNKETTISLEDFLSSFPAEHQDLIRQTFSALSRTRRSGRITPGAANRVASSLADFAPQAVLRACDIYLSRDHAGSGKNEKYLLGIVKSLARSEAGVPTEAPEQTQYKTEGTLAIEMAIAAQRKEKEGVLPE
jgi:hypothetical protein